MYVSTGGPYRNQYNPYDLGVWDERRQIRSTASGVCWTALLGVLLMVFVLPLAFRPYLSSFSSILTQQNGFDGLPPVLYYLVLAVDYIVGLAVPAFLYFAWKHVPLSEGLPFHRAGAGNLALYIAFGCMVCMLANYPAGWVSVVQRHFGFSGDLPSMPLTNSPLVLLLYAVNVVVIPPLVEEIMFRGVVLQSMRRFGDGFAILFSSILFGLYHGNFIQMVFAFFCGLVMSFAVVRTDSLLPSILIHFINNSVSLVVELTERFKGQAMAAYVDNILSIVLVAAGVAALGILFSRHKLFAGKRPSGPLLPLSVRMGAAFGNFGAVSFILYGFLSSVFTLYHA